MAIQPGMVCNLLGAIEPFLMPGVENWFNGQCVPQIQAQISACNGELQSEVEEMADEMCGDISSELHGICEKIPLIGQYLAPLFKPNGLFPTQCDADLGAFLVKQVEQQCQGIGSLNAQEVCNEAFGEMWSEITEMLNSQFCKNYGIIRI